MPIFERSFTGNKELLLAANMKYESLRNFTWGRWGKFNAPGKKTVVKKADEAKPVASPVVIQHELTRKQGDVMEMPMLRDLINLPTGGKKQLAGHEEEVNINHCRVPIDVVRHAVDVQDGIMSWQTTKEYELLRYHKPLLSRHYAQTNEFLGANWAMCYGFSENVLNSSRFTGNNQNIKAISHPNIFCAGIGQVSYGVNGFPGTSDYESEIGTTIGQMVETNVFDTTFLSGLKASDTVQDIDPIILKDGNELWMILASPLQVKDLEADPAFQKTVAQTHAIQLAKDNPLLVGSKYIWSGFAIFVSNTAPMPVSVVGGRPVWGPNPIVNLRSFRGYSKYSYMTAYLVGSNALFKAIGRAFEFKKRTEDFDEIIAVAYRSVEGWSRGDFWNYDDGIVGEHVRNFGSANLITAISPPGM